MFTATDWIIGMENTDALLLGRRVRDFRKMRGLSMRELARLAGVSAGFISQIENGQANASLQTVRALADTFGIQWMDLFEAKPVHGRVLKKADRPKLASSAAVRHFGITQPPIRDVEVLVSEYEPGESVGDPNYTHGDSHEIVVILRGSFRFRLQDDEFDLEQGDSVDYRTSTPHMLTNTGDTVGEALWVVTPPSGQSAAESYNT